MSSASAQLPPSPHSQPASSQVTFPTLDTRNHSLTEQLSPPLTTSSLLVASPREQNLQIEDLVDVYETTFHDLVVLTGIFRFRTQPSVPYHLISKILTYHFPEPVRKWWEIAHQPLKPLPSPSTPGQTVSSSDSSRKLELVLASETEYPVTIEHWLSLVLATEYEAAERSGGEVFLETTAEDGRVVGELLFELGLMDSGYVVRNDRELSVYMRWLRTDDWKFGSEPLLPLHRGENGRRGPLGDRHMCAMRGVEYIPIDREVCFREQYWGADESVCPADRMRESIESLASLEKEMLKRKCEERRESIAISDEFIKGLQETILMTDKFKTTSCRGSLHQFMVEDVDCMDSAAEPLGESSDNESNVCSPQFTPAAKIFREEDCPVHDHCAPRFVSQYDYQSSHPARTPPPQHRLPYTSPLFNSTSYPAPHALCNYPPFEHPLSTSYHGVNTFSQSTTPPGTFDHGAAKASGDSANELTIEYDPTELVRMDAKKTSRAMQLNSNWTSFGEQIEEIREFERAEKTLRDMWQ